MTTYRDICDILVRNPMGARQNHQLALKEPIKSELQRLMKMLIGDYSIHASIFYHLKQELCYSYDHVHEAARGMLFSTEPHDHCSSISYVTLLCCSSVQTQSSS